MKKKFVILCIIIIALMGRFLPYLLGLVFQSEALFFSIVLLCIACGFFILVVLLLLIGNPQCRVYDKRVHIFIHSYRFKSLFIISLVSVLILFLEARYIYTHNVDYYGLNRNGWGISYGGRNSYGISDCYGNPVIPAKYESICICKDMSENEIKMVGINRYNELLYVFVLDKKGKLCSKFTLTMLYGEEKLSDVLFSKIGPIEWESEYCSELKYIDDKWRSLSDKNFLVSCVDADDTPDVKPIKEERTYKQEVPKEHKRTIPVQVWKQCVNCLGSGQCSYCYGQNFVIDGYGNESVCPVCTGGRCSMCAGQGGHYEVEYQTITE